MKEAVAEGADIRYCDNKMKRPLQYAQEKLARLNQEVLSPIEEKKRMQLMSRNSYQDVVQFLTNKLNEQIWNAVQRESLERVQTLHECGAELNWCRPEQPFGKQEGKTNIVFLQAQTCDSSHNHNARTLLNLIMPCDNAHNRPFASHDFVSALYIFTLYT